MLYQDLLFLIIEQYDIFFRTYSFFNTQEHLIFFNNDSNLLSSFLLTIFVDPQNQKTQSYLKLELVSLTSSHAFPDHHMIFITDIRNNLIYVIQSFINYYPPTLRQLTSYEYDYYINSLSQGFINPHNDIDKCGFETVLWTPYLESYNQSIINGLQYTKNIYYITDINSAAKKCQYYLSYGHGVLIYLDFIIKLYNTGVYSNYHDFLILNFRTYLRLNAPELFLENIITSYGQEIFNNTSTTHIEEYLKKYNNLLPKFNKHITFSQYGILWQNQQTLNTKQYVSSCDPQKTKKLLPFFVFLSQLTIVGNDSFPAIKLILSKSDLQININYRMSSAKKFIPERLLTLYIKLISFVDTVDYLLPEEIIMLNFLIMLIVNQY